MSPAIEAAVTEALTVCAMPLVVVEEMGCTWMNEAARKLAFQGSAQQVLVESPNSVQRRLANAICDAARVDGSERGLDAFSVESSIRLEDGQRIPIAIAASTFQESSAAVLGLLSDLRATREAQAAVRRAEERFERLVESLIASVWILKRRRVVYANRAAARLFGVDRTLLIGVEVSELLHPDDVPGLLDHLERVERGESVLPHEYRAISRDGSMLVVEFSSVSLDYDGEPSVLSFGRDVTERKREELRMLQSDRLSALGMLASGMAHALNNPLTYVLLNLEHLSRRLAAASLDSDALADATARLTEAREGAERMATIVRRMRAFARADESSPRGVDLRSVLESVVDLVGHEVHHRGRLTTRFESVPPVLASQSKVEQICLGLLLFAAQVLPDDASRRYEVRMSLEADERKLAVLEVVCEGCHFAEPELERLFEPLPASEDGRVLGFGLSVCRTLVEQLGGQIDAKTLPGTGLLLRTAIPYVPASRSADSKVPSSRPSSIPPPTSGKAQVLVVDDDPGVARALRLMLEDEHEVTCMANPREALRELLGNAKYDLVFCDLMMPELSGMDIYQVLRFNRPGYEAKMVFMTGGAFTPAVRRFLEQVPNQRLEKPFNLRSLRRLVQRSVRHRPCH